MFIGLCILIDSELFIRIGKLQKRSERQYTPFMHGHDTGMSLNDVPTTKTKTTEVIQ